MTNVLTNPDRFFAELSAKDTKLMTPFAIVLVSAIIAAICTMVMFRVMYSFPENVAFVFSTFATINTISDLITPFISWFLFAAAFYVVSMLFKGEGSFVRVFEFVGYGFIPMIIASVLGLVTTLILTSAVGFPLNNPELLWQTMMQHLSIYGPVMVVSVTIQFLIMLWSVVIWVFGVKHVRNLGMGHAIITVLGGCHITWCLGHILAGGAVG